MPTLSKEQVLADSLPIYRKLSTDDQDSVRLLTVDDLIAIASKLSPAEVNDQLRSSLRSAVSDKSWRVRYMVADHFVKVRFCQSPLGTAKLNKTLDLSSSLKQLVKSL